MASDSLRDAMQRAVRYGRMISDAARLELEEGERESGFFLVPMQALTATAALDAGLAVMMRMCRDLYGAGLNPTRVTMMRPGPADPVPHRQLFRAPLVFDAQRHGLQFPNEILDAQLSTANPHLVRVNDQVVVDYLAALDRSQFAHQTRAQVARQLPTGRPGQKFVARQLNVSSRTLQRRLAAEGTNFQMILEGARRELAVGYLKDERFSVGEIAYLLGYSDPANFTKAFKRWQGCTPTEWRSRPGDDRQAG